MCTYVCKKNFKSWPGMKANFKNYFNAWSTTNYFIFTKYFSVEMIRKLNWKLFAILIG